ncbi:hypothetical protein SE_0176 [Staphylococcus epidermidis ATCC 12228]|uniref:Secreted protein n=1 Tax=Staphylococcus epidermidis (strain ATCC 12228 / FDA PCI 1200) TaxID=176280 RepID=A0A0H2VGZ8_STAES|nr:hypothetical protein SE_0176 [Staphylococcus epidermidis ATCC 12228]
MMPPALATMLTILFANSAPSSACAAVTVSTIASPNLETCSIKLSLPHFVFNGRITLI